MTYSTITSCRMCKYATMDRSTYYCGKGLEPTLVSCGGYQEGRQAEGPRPLPKWDNPYPIHPHQRHRAMGCKILPINRDNAAYTNVMILDRYAHPFVEHKTSSDLVVDMLNIMDTYHKVTKTLMDCKFKSAYGVDYRHCLSKKPAEVSTSISMLWGVYKVQVYVQVLVFSLVDAYYYRPYIQNEKNGYENDDTPITGPWWEQKDTRRMVINEVPEQYWWLDPEVDADTLKPIHALLSVLIEILERDYRLDSWTYSAEATPILTGALNMGLQLRGQPWLNWLHTLYPFLDRHFTEKVQIEVRDKWQEIMQRVQDPGRASWL